jgi:hypothetical protein
MPEPIFAERENNKSLGDANRRVKATGDYAYLRC